MKKILGIFALFSIALVLVSCGGGGGGGGGGGEYVAAPTSNSATTCNTYTGSFSVNGTNYTSLTIGNGRYTLAGNNGTDTGTYATETATAAMSLTSSPDVASALYSAVSIEDGRFVLTSTTHNGTWKINLSRGTISIHNGSLSASGTGNVVSQGGSLIGRWFYPDSDPNIVGGGYEIEVKNNSQLVIRFTCQEYDNNQGRMRQYPISITIPYTATENTITLTNTILDCDVGGLTDDEQMLLFLVMMFFGDDVDAGDGSTETGYYAVKGNLLILADDAALSENVDVLTRR